jgi:NAD(P)-dependent dehydrogenase (short-subunit alcohol dehydrogenase family)
MMKSKGLVLSGIFLGTAAGLAIAKARQRAAFSFRGKTVVVTGGSRGLGLVLSRQLALEGARLVLLARSEPELRRAELDLTQRGAEVLVVPCDLRSKEQVDSAISQAAARYGGVDVLINNAGIIQVGPMEHMTLEDFENCLGVHFYGPLHTTLAAVPHMRRAGGGRIVNIASIGGKIATPHLLPYTASKFALVGLSEGLQSELRRHNILVTTVIPGLMRTGSPPNAQFKGKHHHEYAWFAVSGALPLVSVDANRAGAEILKACRKGVPRLVIGCHTRAALLVNEMFPSITARLLALINWCLPGPEPSGSTQVYSGWESQSWMAPSFLTKLSDEASLKNNERPY